MDFATLSERQKTIFASLSKALADYKKANLVRRKEKAEFDDNHINLQALNQSGEHNQRSYFASQIYEATIKVHDEYVKLINEARASAQVIIPDTDQPIRGDETNAQVTGQSNRRP